MLRALLLFAVFGACMTSPSDRTSISHQDLICDPNCDPGSAQYVMSQVVGDGKQWYGTQTSVNTGCHYFEATWNPDGTYIPATEECWSVFADPWGQRYLVDCADQGDGALCGDSGIPCDQPGQVSCRS